MAAPGDDSPNSPDADPPVFGPPAPAEDGPHRLRPAAFGREISLGKRRRRALVIIGGIAAAVVAAASTGAISLPGTQDSTQQSQTGQAARAATQMAAADQRWASATCANILDWKNHIHHDATSLNLGFGPLARIKDAIAATTRMSNQIGNLGLPPAPRTAQARAEIDQLRSDIESRVHSIEGTAGSVASGNPAAIGALLSDLENETVLEAPIVNELRHVVSVDLGLSLVETRACRELVGIPI
jgi:hypothetical protein